VKRVHQTVLIVSTILACWLGMQGVHESGHVLGALLSGGTIRHVVLSPLTISRTDLAENPAPLLVVWAGPIFGVLLPVAAWGISAVMRMPGAFVVRFFAGFCLIANGAYIGIGSFGAVGDCGEMLRHGSALWQLWLFGAITVPIGFGLWHRQGPFFGLGAAEGNVNPVVAHGTFVVAVLLLVLGFVVGGA
jgi:hypothetical protein